jgi:mannitol/fructose-specific phosphotransferase system IIA component (Ntr-type)
MSLVDQITPEVVKVPLESRDKVGVIDELVKVLQDAGRIDDWRKAADAVHRRESLASTGLEAGVAVPHAKTDAVSRLTISIGIAPEGIEFNAADGKPSHIFFLILAAPDQSGPHIQALAEIARLAKSRAFLRSLTSARTPQEVVDLFCEE